VQIHERIVAAIGAKLAEDGFTRPSSADVFVKPLASPWQAWVSVAGDSFTLDPMAGIMNTELNDIYLRAKASVGNAVEKRLDGPPLLMVDLEKLAADCASCSKDAPWEYHGEILTEVVVGDLVDCLRRFAYPFFEKYSSLEAIMEGAKERMAGYALPWFAPIILIKLGRIADAKAYAEHRSRWLPDDEHGKEYQRYCEALMSTRL